MPPNAALRMPSRSRLRSQARLWLLGVAAGESGGCRSRQAPSGFVPGGRQIRMIAKLHARMTAFPDWVVPMAATLTQDRFTGPEWIFERKFDGIRLLAFKRGIDVRLFSRNRLPQVCPPIARAIGDLHSGDLILDGELTWGHAGTRGM